MIRATLAALALVATIAATGSALAQTAAPVRSLGVPAMDRGAAVAIAERKGAACTARNCMAKPPKRDVYVAAAPLGW